jgi:deazaflavin-dependent oxidoreductase (nitroreductase family)
MMSKDEFEKGASEKLVYLTTRGRRSGKLHTVEIWFAVRYGKMYLSHEGKETDWMKNIKNNGQVSFRIGRKNFHGNAHYLEDGMEESWMGKVALYEKYYGKATKDVIKDWFSLSRLLVVEIEGIIDE